MKILEISTLFPRWPGDGRGPIVYQIAQALKNEGHEVTVISLHGPRSKKYEIMEGIKVIRPRYAWPDKFEILQDTGGGLPAAWEKRPFTRPLYPSLLVAQTIAVLQEAPHYDILHAHFTIPAMAATLSLPFHKKPIVATVRGSDIYRIPNYPFGKLFNKIALSGCRKITAMSYDLVSALLKSGIPESRIEYTPPPVNLDGFSSLQWGNREPLLVYVASLIPRKGPIYLIQAFKEVAKQFPDYRLVMVGKGPEEHVLKTFAQASGLQDRIAFIPYLTPAEVAELLRKAQLFILPSLEEALGMVIVEALASGTPVVATNVGGIPEAVSEGFNADLVQPGDSDALARTIIGLLGNQTKLRQYSEHARIWAKTHFYSHSDNAKHLIRVFENILGVNNNE